MSYRGRHARIPLTLGKISLRGAQPLPGGRP
jgi:hypothetical protein